MTTKERIEKLRTYTRWLRRRAQKMQPKSHSRQTLAQRLERAKHRDRNRQLAQDHGLLTTDY